MEEGKPARRSDTVSASELAQMGVCERLVRYEARYGKRMSADQRTAIERGRREHDRFFRDAAVATPGVQTMVTVCCANHLKALAVRGNSLRRLNFARSISAAYDLELTSSVAAS